MYLDLFGLKEPPFRLTPDPDFLFLSKHHARAKAYMESALWYTDGFVVITGEIGSGKTTLIQSFMSEIDDDIVTAKLSQTQLTPVQFLQGVLAEFGFKPFRKRKAELIDMLNMYLIEKYGEGKKVLLIIDEAQNLSKHVLEEVRLLSGIETHKEKVLRIVFAGQPELNDTLDAADMQQLAQRIRLRLHLGPLSKAETRAYINHRLDIAGARRQIFDSNCIPVIFGYTGGIPRLINTLCDTTMMVAFADDISRISQDMVETAVEELDWVKYNERASRFAVSAPKPPEPDGRTFGRLIIAFEGRTTNEFPLSAGRLIIGRTADNDMQIDSQFISRHHAQIITSPDSSIIEDLNSTNGIYIGKKRIKRHRLKDGNVLILGKHQLTYRTDYVAE